VEAGQSLRPAHVVDARPVDRRGKGRLGNQNADSLQHAEVNRAGRTVPVRSPGKSWPPADACSISLIVGESHDLLSSNGRPACRRSARMSCIVLAPAPIMSFPHGQFRRKRRAFHGPRRWRTEEERQKLCSSIRRIARWGSCFSDTSNRFHDRLPSGLCPAPILNAEWLGAPYEACQERSVDQRRLTLSAPWCGWNRLAVLLQDARARTSRLDLPAGGMVG